mgnify:CR=1 FL=1
MKIDKKNRKVLMVRDVMPGDPNKDPEPWTWIRTHGKGRVFYTASGHDERVWSNKNFQKLIKNGTISGGMIPKIETCVNAVREGVKAAVILNGKVSHAILLEIFTERGVGTLITS